MNIHELARLLREEKEIHEVDLHQDEILELIPKAVIMVDYDQQNQAHQYNLWDHCLHTTANLPSDIEDDMLYIAAFLHDIGKPDCQVPGMKNGKINMHYNGHPERSYEIVRDEVIPFLLSRGECLDEDEQRRLLYYVEHHDDHVELGEASLQAHRDMGASIQEFRNLMELEVADAKAHVLIPIVQYRIEICGQLAKIGL